MKNSFSSRNKITTPDILALDSISEGLKTRLWNIINKYIDTFNDDRNRIIEMTWDRFFKGDIADLHTRRNYTSDPYYIDEIKGAYFRLEWYKIYDFLEFILDFSNKQKNHFTDAVNSILDDENAQYRIIDDQVASLISQHEADEITMAIEETPAANHISKALELYSKRPHPDYKNSIKESISALESIARKELNNESATLGELADKLPIHPSLSLAIKKLYGWASDASGVRHAEKSKEVVTINQEDARLALVLCSSLSTYITLKQNS